MFSAARRTGFAAVVKVLACALALALAGCGGEKPTAHETIKRYSQELREAVSTRVPDGERRAQLLMIVDQMEALHLRFSQETADFVASYRKLSADYDAPRPAFDQLFADYSAKRIKARSEALDLHFHMASLASAGEWDAIGKAEIELYEEAGAARPAEEGTK
jgi:hypothetical protein